MAKKNLYKSDGTEDFDAEAQEAENTSFEPGAVSDMLAEDGEGAGKSSATDGSSDSDTTNTESATDEAPSSPGTDVAAPKPEVAEDEHDKAHDGEASDTGNSGHPAVDAALSQAKGDVDGQASVGEETGSVAPLSAADGTANVATPDQGSDAAQGEKQDAPAASANPSDSSASTDSSGDQPKLAEPLPEAAPVVDIAPDVLDELKEAGNKLSPALKKLADFEHKFAELESEAKARFDHMRQKVTEAVAALEGIFKRS